MIRRVVFGGCTASVDVERVGPAPGEPDELKGNLVSRLTNEAPARVFHQGPGICPLMTICSFAVRHLLIQHRHAFDLKQEN
jgi:hypothetical protein